MRPKRGENVPWAARVPVVEGVIDHIKGFVEAWRVEAPVKVPVNVVKAFLDLPV
jgi:hypothetical protein